MMSQNLYVFQRIGDYFYKFRGNGFYASGFSSRTQSRLRSALVEAFVEPQSAQQQDSNAEYGKGRHLLP